MIRRIQELHRQRCNEGGNINEHLPLLYMLSLDSEGVCEFGIDRGISTSALIAGQDTRSQLQLPASYQGYDVRAECKAEVDRLINLCESQQYPRIFRMASSITIKPIEPVDFLLIDSEHTEAQIAKELAIHMQQVRKYIALHDTVAFGENGEKPGTRGILYGIQPLLDESQWLKVYDSPRNNGMAVFRRRQAYQH